jgi:nucleotide-binding universal stress UspA family protein
MAAPALALETQLKLRNILFATDFSEGAKQALPYVGSLARAFGAAVHLCHVDDPVPFSSGVAAPKIYEAQGRVTAEHLTELLNAPSLKGLDLKVTLGQGGVGDEVGRLVRDKDIDLIIAGTHGRTGLKHLMLGSVVEEICRTATCPVLTVGPGTSFRKDVPFSRILFPTNLTDSSDKILPYVILLASEFGAQVTALHIIPRDDAEIVTAQDHQLAATIRKAMETKLHPLLAFFRPEFLVVVGDPAEAILRIAAVKNADLIAMGIKNVFAPVMHLRASTAYQIIAGAHRPVLTLK